MDLECREVRPEEARLACEFTETIFGPLPFEYWAKEPGFTASMAWLEGELVGVIPFSLRRFRLAPDIVADTAWENAVGTREDMRSRGIGTAMIHAAREFLLDRSDLLCVYRGAERSNGYRFYADRTEHVDLCYVPFYHLAEPDAHRPDGFATLDHEAVSERAAELTRLFHSHWSAFGGYTARDEAYYPWMTDNIIYGRIPTIRRLHLLTEGGAVVAFAITGQREGRRADGSCRIMDFACAHGSMALAERLLQGVLAYAADESCPVSWPLSMNVPLLPLLEAHGFVQGPRRMEIMAYPIRPQNLFAKLVEARGGCELTVDTWTPKVDYRLYDAGETAPQVTLEMKDRELCLMLASRLDGRGAMDEERITAYGGAPRDKVRETLARLLRCAPWVHHYLDWL